jgi:WD40 repeat protein
VGDNADMRNASRCLILVAAMALGHGCSCSHNGLKGDGGDTTDMTAPSGGDIVITPADATLDITPGGAAATQAYTAKLMNGQDVTAQASWSVDDTTLGAFASNTFTSNVDHGGSTLVHASYNGLTGYATIHVKLHASVPSDNCPSCPPFPPDNTPACTATSQTPTVLYPADGTLVPPNMNVLALQFDQGAGNTLFEIDYENAATDVRVETMCKAITDSKGGATNGCVYDLSQQVWDYIAQSNRGGDPLDIIIKATDASGSCVATSQTQVRISFAQEDLNGGIYYWQSVNVAGLQGATGGIFRYDFGKRGQTPQAFLAPTASGGMMQRCVGCHFLSRDGQKMTYGNDDPDADDEYSDLKTSLIDVATKVAVATNQPGFQAFAPDHSTFLASDGLNKLTNQFSMFDGNTGAAASPSTVSSGAARGTQPDYSADGSKVVFVQPANFKFATYNRLDDNHFTGGSLFTMTASGTVFGTPQPLLPSQGENNYYPAFSPDGAFVIFNRVPLSGMAAACMSTTTSSGVCPNDAFSNPAARIMLMPAAGGTPIDLANINAASNLTNSWPRFAPTVQTYKGDQIAWVTFSSTRDYGDVVRNSAMVGGAMQHLCYPPESPENGSTNKNVTTDPSCLQPQLWMAAINLSKAASGADPSVVAFWLPFQDPTAHNHIAQWVVQLVGPPATGDMGTCVPDGVTCATGGAQCCNGVCCSNNTCGCIP